jgi:metal transporter CNNM
MKKIVLINSLVFFANAQAFYYELIVPNTKVMILSDDDDDEEEVVHKSGNHEPFSFDWYIDLTVALWCLLIAGLMAGLILGLASIDHLSLEITSKKSKKLEKSCNRIFAVIHHHHWMLVTLLLINAAGLETLPIYLNKAMDEFLAILIAVVGVLFIGQLIP